MGTLIKFIAGILAALGLVSSAGTAHQLVGGSSLATSTATATYFAHLDKNGVVDNVIVATPEFIATGAEGDPATWIQTYYDRSIRYNYAGTGDTYDAKIDGFIPPGKTAGQVLTQATATPAALDFTTSTGQATSTPL